MTKEQIISKMQESKVTGDESARWWNGGINRCIDLANKLDDPTDITQLLEAAREAEEAKQLVLDLLPPDKHGEDYDVARLYEILEGISSALKPFGK